MAVWMVRAAMHGEAESTALDNGVAVIGWAKVARWLHAHLCSWWHSGLRHYLHSLVRRRVCPCTEHSVGSRCHKFGARNEPRRRSVENGS